MKKILIVFTVMAVSNLFMATNSFGAKLYRIDACSKDHVPGDPCTYTKVSSKTGKNKEYKGFCVTRPGMDDMICKKNKK